MAGRTHARAPAANDRAVLGTRHMGVTGWIFGFGYRGIYGSAALIGGFDVLLARVATIHEPLTRPLPMVPFDLIEHRGELAEITAEVAHADPDDDLAMRAGSELDVVGRTKATVGHLHHARFGIGARSTRLGTLGVYFRGLGELFDYFVHFQ